MSPIRSDIASGLTAARLAVEISVLLTGDLIETCWTRPVKSAGVLPAVR